MQRLTQHQPVHNFWPKLYKPESKSNKFESKLNKFSKVQEGKPPIWTKHSTYRL